MAEGVKIWAYRSHGIYWAKELLDRCSETTPSAARAANAGRLPGEGDKPCVAAGKDRHFGCTTRRIDRWLQCGPPGAYNTAAIHARGAPGNAYNCSAPGILENNKQGGKKVNEKMNWKEWVDIVLGCAVVILAIVLSGCNIRPNVTAGYYLELLPESKGSVTIGSNGTQSNAIHAPVTAPPAKVADTVATENEAKSVETGALFVNSGQFTKTSDTDLSAAYEALKNVKGSTAGQAQTAGGSTGASTQNPSNTTSEEKTTTLNTPVSLTKTGTASASTAGDAGAADGGKSAGAPTTNAGE